jgi:nucleotide-binding universal stress UspA family protein
MYRHILVPTDGSVLSDQAAAAAVDLAALMGARITALHVVPEIPAIELEAWARHDERYIEHLEKAFEKRAMMHLGKVRELADKARVTCETVYLHAASPASEIVITAGDRKCDLIFMASHGMGEAADPLLGSVTAKVLARGRIPVLVHRTAIG